jgi:hypothetical protein
MLFVAALTRAAIPGILHFEWAFDGPARRRAGRDYYGARVTS